MSDTTPHRSAAARGKPALADLHRHLDGSLRPSTVLELADERGIRVPDSLAFYPGMGLHEALGRFAFTLSLLQSPATVCRVAAEICADAAAHGVTTLELRFAPQLHVDDGASMAAIVDAAIDGLAGRAGLILCALYGEPPSLVEALVRLAERRPAVVGIDLAGGPTPTQNFGMQDYATAFDRARRIDLGRTVHAGEGRPADEIRVAIETLHAQRIGHGVTLLDDPAVTELVLERDVVIEACPTSNLQTGCIPAIEEHPLARWLDLGIKACVNTDNTLFSDTNAEIELSRAAHIQGMDEAKLARVVQIGHASAFPFR